MPVSTARSTIRFDGTGAVRGSSLIASGLIAQAVTPGVLSLYDGPDADAPLVAEVPIASGASQIDLRMRFTQGVYVGFSGGLTGNVALVIA